MGWQWESPWTRWVQCFQAGGEDADSLVIAIGVELAVTAVEELFPTLLARTTNEMPATTTAANKAQPAATAKSILRRRSTSGSGAVLAGFGSLVAARIPAMRRSV